MPILLSRIATPKNSGVIGGGVFLAGVFVLAGWLDDESALADDIGTR